MKMYPYQQEAIDALASGRLYFPECKFEMRFTNPRAIISLPPDPGWPAPLRREVGNALVLAAGALQLADFDMALAVIAYSAAVTMGIVFE